MAFSLIERQFPQKDARSLVLLKYRDFTHHSGFGKHQDFNTFLRETPAKKKRYRPSLITYLAKLGSSAMKFSDAIRLGSRKVPPVRRQRIVYEAVVPVGACALGFAELGACVYHCELIDSAIP